MLRTGLCDLFGIEYPIIQASLGPWPVVELASAVSGAGGLGSVGTTLRSVAELEEHLGRMRELTDKPFAVNHTARPFDEGLFSVTLRARPKVVSMALGDPGELVERAHEAGALFMQQVTTVEQAELVAERGVDVVVAQGGEAGGYGGTISTMTLVPQVVDAVGPIPVVAAGGIADGRGLAAALLLGAQGVNIGTRFLASTEAAVAEDWKKAIVEARSGDAVKIEFARAVFPPPNRDGAFENVLPRALRTPFVDEWNRRRDEAQREAERLKDAFMTSALAGKAHELTPFTGQTAGMIQDLLPAGEIVRGMAAEAEKALLTVADSLRRLDGATSSGGERLP